jgi:predicted N-acetyltransferase YhbS
MDYRPVTSNDHEAVRELLARSGWQGRVKDVEKFRKMLDNADRTVIALDNGQVVGFARALCDDVSNGYISMVVVAEEKRGQGIGRELVTRLIGDNKDITWVLRAGKNSGNFWKKMGFSVSSIAMERTRPIELEAINE